MARPDRRAANLSATAACEFVYIHYGLMSVYTTRCTDMGGEPVKVTIYLPDALAAEVKAGLTDTNISAVCQVALRAELERERAMEKIDADGYQRVVLYDGKREHDIAFRGRKVGSS